MSLKARSRNQPTRLVAAWVLCCAYSLSRVQLFATAWTIAHQAPLSMGILQARVLEWVAMPSSRGSSQSKNQTRVSCFAGGLFNSWATREAPSCLDTEVYVKGSLHIKNTWGFETVQCSKSPSSPHDGLTIVQSSALFFLARCSRSSLSGRVPIARRHSWCSFIYSWISI